MSTHNICFYKEVDTKYMGCSMKTTKLLDCALIGVCAVIRSNTVGFHGEIRKTFFWILPLSGTTLFTIFTHSTRPGGYKTFFHAQLS